jgi:hypothetical protein
MSPPRAGRRFRSTNNTIFTKLLTKFAVFFVGSFHHYSAAVAAAAAATTRMDWEGQGTAHYGVSDSVWVFFWVLRARPTGSMVSSGRRGTASQRDAVGRKCDGNYNNICNSNSTTTTTSSIITGKSTTAATDISCHDDEEKNQQQYCPAIVGSDDECYRPPAAAVVSGTFTASYREKVAKIVQYSHQFMIFSRPATFHPVMVVR